MLQKELAKRLRGRFETEMDGDGWLAVPVCLPQARHPTRLLRQYPSGLMFQSKTPAVW